MLYFVIALLIIATIFLLLGLLGRGLEGGAGAFTIKVEGKVGRVPRIVFLIFSGINYTVALVLFLAIFGAWSSSSSSTTTVTTQQTEQAGPPQVTIDISDQLSSNENAEKVTININGDPAISLIADSNNSNPDQNVTLAEGEHDYQITVQGVTTDGIGYDYAGQGTLLAEQGNSYSVVYDSNTDAVALQPG